MTEQIDVAVQMQSINVAVTMTGPAGPGVPVGGATGQVLTKNSGNNYDTGWQTPYNAKPFAIAMAVVL